MSKWYEVNVRASTVVMVEVEDNESAADAESVAIAETVGFDNTECEGVVLLENDYEIESGHRRASESFPLPADEAV